VALAVFRDGLGFRNVGGGCMRGPGPDYTGNQKAEDDEGEVQGLTENGRS
jgi:hypothetical protein